MYIGKRRTTFDVKVGDHVAKLLDVLGEMGLAGDALEAGEAGLGEAGGDAGELVDGAELGEAATGEAEVGEGVGLVRGRRGRRLEALLGEVGAAVEVDELVGVGFDVVEDLAEELVGESHDAGRRHCGRRGKNWYEMRAGEDEEGDEGGGGGGRKERRERERKRERWKGSKGK